MKDEEINKYKKQLFKIMKKLDLNENHKREMLEVFYDISEEFDLNEFSFDEIEAVIGSPSEFTINYFESRGNYLSDKPSHSHDKRIEYLKKRRVIGGKFAPQYSKTIFVMFISLIMISFSYFVRGLVYELNDSSAYIGDGIFSFISFYLIYEIFAGISGWNFTSRKIGLKLRLLFRIYSYSGMIFYLLMISVSDNFDMKNNYTRELYSFIIALEIIILFRENFLGFIPLNLNSIKQNTPKHKISDILLLVILLFNFIIMNFDDTFPVYYVYILVIISLILHVTNKISFLSDKLYLIGILPIISLFKYTDNWLTYREFIGDMSIDLEILYLKFIGIFISLFVFVIMFFNHSENLNENDKILTSHVDISSFIEEQEIKSCNYLNKKKYRLYLIFIIPISNNLYNLLTIDISEKIYGGYTNYFRLPIQFKIKAELFFFISIMIFYILIETRQKYAITYKSNIIINLRQFYNIKKFILIIFIIVSITSTSIVTSNYAYSNVTTDSEIYTSDLGDIRLRACTNCGTNTSKSTYFEFIDAVNNNYSKINLPGVESFIYALTVSIEIRMSDWNAFFSMYIVNQSILQDYLLNYLPEDKIIDFDSEFYITNPSLFEKLKKEENLLFTDGYQKLNISKDNFALLENDVGFNLYSSVIFTSFSSLAKMDITLRDDYSTQLMYGNELYTEYTDLQINFKMIKGYQSESQIDELYKEFNKLFNKNTNYGVYYISPIIESSYPIYLNNSFILILISGLINGFIISIFLISSNILLYNIKGDMIKKRLIRLNIQIGLITLIYNAIGIVYGLYSMANTSGIFIGHTNKLRSSFDINQIIIYIGLQFIIQMLIQLIYTRKRIKSKLNLQENNNG